MNKKLLYRFFEGVSSPEDEQIIHRWLEQSPINHQIFLQERITYDALLLNSPESLKHNKRSKISWWQVSAIASIALLLLVSTVFLLLLNGKNSSKIAYNTILVPPGQRMNLVLADQTNVWLNANTKFSYPTEFSKKNRTVFIDGEAYFEVSKNEKKPFIVQTTHGDIQVTGTSFNVEAYSDFDYFETSLFEGSVNILRNNQQLVSLKPNEKSVLANNKLTISAISDTDEFLWKKGLIAFNNKSLQDILTSFEKYFDVQIQTNAAKLPQHTYTGKFRQSDGIDYALRVLQRSIRFSYERNDETGVIYIN